MTLNELIQYAKENNVDFDTPLVAYEHGMEYSTYKNLSSISAQGFLKKEEKRCYDSFDRTSYTQTVYNKTTDKTDTKVLFLGFTAIK